MGAVKRAIFVAFVAFLWGYLLGWEARGRAEGVRLETGATVTAYDKGE